VAVINWTAVSSPIGFCLFLLDVLLSFLSVCWDLGKVKAVSKRSDPSPQLHCCRYKISLKQLTVIGQPVFFVTVIPNGRFCLTILLVDICNRLLYLVPVTTKSETVEWKLRSYINNGWIPNLSKPNLTLSWPLEADTVIKGLSQKMPSRSSFKTLFHPNKGKQTTLSDRMVNNKQSML